MSQNRSLSSSLKYSTHFLSVKGDLRSQYQAWAFVPSGQQSYSYIKLQSELDKTYFEFEAQNLDDTGKSNAVAAFATAVINEDASLYNLASSDSGDPYLTTPVWTAASFSPLTIVPGGKVRQSLSIASSGYNTQVTVVVRVQLTGAPIKLEAWSDAATTDEY